LPRFAARRRIPAQAFELKKNRGGIEPLLSTCDNEHTAASLGQAEILGIENPPRDCSLGSSNHTRVRPFPPRRSDGGIFSRQSCEESPEGVVLDTEDAGDVFPDDDGGLSSGSMSKIVNCICKPYKFEGEVAAVIVQGLAEAGHAECLAGRATDQHIGISDECLIAQLGEVAVDRNVRVMVRQHGARERLDLRERKWLPAERMPCH